jgi:hypothetical protein
MGEFKMGFFEVVGGTPRGGVEEGGPIGVHSVHLGEFYWVVLSCKCGWGDQLVRGFLRAKPKDELFR